MDAGSYGRIGAGLVVFFIIAQIALGVCAGVGIGGGIGLILAVIYSDWGLLLLGLGWGVIGGVWLTLSIGIVKLVVHLYENRQYRKAERKREDASRGRLREKIRRGRHRWLGDQYKVTDEFTLKKAKTTKTGGLPKQRKPGVLYYINGGESVWYYCPCGCGEFAGLPLGGKYKAEDCWEHELHDDGTLSVKKQINGQLCRAQFSIKRNKVVWGLIRPSSDELGA